MKRKKKFAVTVNKSSVWSEIKDFANRNSCNIMNDDELLILGNLAKGQVIFLIHNFFNWVMLMMVLKIYSLLLNISIALHSY